MEIYLQPVFSEQKNKLFYLLQFSLYEESATDGNQINPHGYFDYPYFKDYFNDPQREAYFICNKNENKCLGMVMLHPYTKYNSGYTIAEFLVLPAYRRHQIGLNAALLAFQLHPGYWEVSPAKGSMKASLFWQYVLSSPFVHNLHFENGRYSFQYYENCNNQNTSF